MMKRTVTILFVLILGVLSSSGQTTTEEEIKEIMLDFSYSLGAPNNHIRIEISSRKDPITMKIHSIPISTHQKWQDFKKDTIITISKEQFNQLQAKATKLKDIDRTKANLKGLDGTTCSLKIGDRHPTIYRFWTPDVETKMRGLENFVQLFRDILELAGFDHKKII